MTDLSPAAQAVMDAYANTSDGEYIEGVWVVNERTMLAAALRTAADQLINVKWSVEMWELHQEFYAIATELESPQ